MMLSGVVVLVGVQSLCRCCGCSFAVVGPVLQDNPITDLRGSGLLALRCLVYFGQQYPEKVSEMIGRQLGNTDARALYPFGITSINVTCMLGDMLGVRDTDLSPPKAVYWPVGAAPRSCSLV